MTVDDLTLSTLVTVTDSLKFKAVAYQVTQSSKFPATLEKSAAFPDKISNLKNTQDDYFLHLGVSAEFANSRDTAKPSQVYLLIRKAGDKNQLSYSRYGKLNPSTGLY